MDVIIIGAGAAGLMAAKELSVAGLTVAVLEARSIIGGRIYTIEDERLGLAIEGGAEFIHGNLPVTLELLREAGVDKVEIKGDVWEVKEDSWSRENTFFKDVELVIKQLKSLKEDISVGQFIEQQFSGTEYQQLREAFIDYVEGYYSADTVRASAKAFLKELMSEEDQQYRPEGGYNRLLNYLAEKSKKAGSIIHLSTVVTQINWEKEWVEVIDEKHNSYIASKVLITIPIGVWDAPENAEGKIAYCPRLPLKAEAVKQMGFGSAIKVLLEFEDIFWEDEVVAVQTKADTKNLQMVLSDMPIPTWWTQLPVHQPLLTGWISGSKAVKMKNKDDTYIVEQSLYSLSKIFKTPVDVLKGKVKSSRVFNWGADPFTRGSYSYSALNSIGARKILMEPVENTLFFAGEALYEGTETGTVEAALTSGQKAASQILLA